MRAGSSVELREASQYDFHEAAGHAIFDGLRDRDQRDAHLLEFRFDDQMVLGVAGKAVEFPND
jgi:phage replication-related protein YjqB (UPF0714/DUF867 family)